MEFRLLGPLEVVSDGRTLPIPGGRPRALLALLLLRPNQIVPTERLIDDLWSGEPPPTAPKMVQMYVGELRKTLEGDVLRTVAPGYGLRVDGDELDLTRFERLLEQARDSDAAAAASLLREALALWRGPPLGEFAYEAWAQTEIARLEELRLAALEERFEADLATGRAGEIVAELETLARQHPFRDRLGAQLMVALYRAGRQTEALQHYQRTRTLLLDELGLEPSPLLQRLERAILTQDSSLDLPAATVLESADEDLPAPESAILVVPRDERRLAELVALAEPLAAAPPARELIVARVVSSADSDALGRASDDLAAQRDGLVGRGLAARVAVFTSPSPGADIARLASDNAVVLVLTDVSPDGPVRRRRRRRRRSRAVRHRAPRRRGASARDRCSRWSCRSAGRSTTGPRSSSARGSRARIASGSCCSGSASRRERRDASRLLADASLLVQKTAGVVAEPRLSRGRRGGL